MTGQKLSKETIRGAAIGVVVGALAGLLVNEATVDTNADMVRSCAHHLGTQAVWARHVPLACQEAELSLGTTFRSVHFPSLTNVGFNVTEHRLPAKQDYLDANLPTAEAKDGRSNAAVLLTFTLLGAGIGAYAAKAQGGGIPSQPGRKRLPGPEVVELPGRHAQLLVELPRQMAA